MTNVLYYRRTRIAAFCAALATTALAAPALAADGDTRTAVVSLSGINLASPAGEQVMRQRIEAAARQVCAAGDTQDLAGLRDYKACYKVSMANASGKLQMAVANARQQHFASNEGVTLTVAGR